MIKKIAILLLTALACLCFLVACNNNTEEEPQASFYTVKFNDLENYVCDVSAASSVGIKKEKASKQDRNAKSTDNSFVSHLSGLFGSITANAEEDTYINSFVMQSDEGKVENVVFKRIVTENADSTLQGERVIRPRKDSGYKYIEFDVEKDFTYTVSDDQGRAIVQDFTDNCDKDLNPTIGYAKVEVGNMGHSYIVRYSGIGREEVLTQEDMECEVQKCYTMGNFTFVTFVPQGYANFPQWSYGSSHFEKLFPLNNGNSNYNIPTEVNFANKTDFVSCGLKQQFGVQSDGLLYRCGGGEEDLASIYNYDSRSYEHLVCNYPSQAYVIDNNSGCIYKLNVNFDYVNEGLVCIAGIVYDMRVNEDKTLEFTPVIKNKTLTIKNFFKDKYGNIYIYNDILNAKDEQNNVLYYTENQYVVTSNGDVLYLDLTDNNATVDVMNEIFERKKFIATEDCDIFAAANKNEYTICNINYIKDGYLYIENCLTRLNVNSLEFEYAPDLYDDSAFLSAQRKGKKISAFIWTKYTDTNNTLYYCEDIWAVDKLYKLEESDTGYKMILNEEVLLKIDDYISDITYDYTHNKIIWYQKVSINGSDTYCIAYNENGIPHAVLRDSYTAEDVDSVILQPINR